MAAITAINEIPLVNTPQSLRITLVGIVYVLTVFWNNADEGGWTLNVADSNSNPIVSGIPLVTGANLLEQYRYLGIGGALFVQTDFDTDATPTFTNLGQLAHLYFVTATP